MEIKSQVIEQQRILLALLTAYERSIADLYEAYAGAFDELSDFWQRLSLDEKKHAAFLDTLTDFLDKGKVFFGLAECDQKALKASRKTVREERTAMATGTVSLRHALRVTFEIETLLVDAHFYSDVKSEAESFELIAAHLAKDEQEHLELVKRIFRERFLLDPCTTADD